MFWFVFKWGIFSFWQYAARLGVEFPIARFINFSKSGIPWDWKRANGPPQTKEMTTFDNAFDLRTLLPAKSKEIGIKKFVIIC